MAEQTEQGRWCFSWIPERAGGADLEPLAGGRASRRLLHGDRALDCVRCGIERDHQPIAEPLHFVPAVRLHGLAQQAMVGLEDALRLLVAGALQ